MTAPVGWLAFRFAALLDKFHLPPGALAGLTDWQLEHLALHERDADGALVPPPAPKRPPTLASRLAGIEQLRALGLITPERAAELRAEAEAHGQV